MRVENLKMTPIPELRQTSFQQDLSQKDQVFVFIWESMNDSKNLIGFSFLILEGAVAWPSLKRQSPIYIYVTLFTRFSSWSYILSWSYMLYSSVSHQTGLEALESLRPNQFMELCLSAWNPRRRGSQVFQKARFIPLHPGSGPVTYTRACASMSSVPPRPHTCTLRGWPSYREKCDATPSRPWPLPRGRARPRKGLARPFVGGFCTQL